MMRHFIHSRFFVPVKASAFITFILLLFSFSASGASDAVFSKAQAKEDLLNAVKFIENHHFSAINGIPSSIKNQHVKEVAALKKTVTLTEIWAAALRITARLNDAHTTVRGKDFFDPEVFNVDYQIEDLDIFIKLKGKKYRVLQINKVPVKSLLKRARTLIPCENVYGFRFGVKDFLTHPTYCRLLGIKIDDGQQIKFLDGHKVRTILIKPTENKDYNQNKIFVSYKIDRKNNCGIFTLTQCCFNDVYKQTLRKFFEEIKHNKITTIAVDLRENQGGTSKVINEFFKYLPCDTYKSVSMFVREGRKIHSFKNSNIKNSRYLPLTYYGEIFVLTSPKTFSAATSFSVHLQDNHLAKVIGEPSGNSPSCYGDTVQTKLPNSSLYLTTTYKKFTRPDESKNDEQAQRMDYPCRAGEALNMLKEIIRTSQ